MERFTSPSAVGPSKVTCEPAWKERNGGSSRPPACRRRRRARTGRRSPRARPAAGRPPRHDVENARRVICGRCTDQVGYVACQGGLGYEKPVTSFTVHNGKVVGVFMAAVAD